MKAEHRAAARKALGERVVRTPEGARRYGVPIGTPYSQIGRRRSNTRIQSVDGWRGGRKAAQLHSQLTAHGYDPNSSSMHGVINQGGDHHLVARDSSGKIIGIASGWRNLIDDEYQLTQIRTVNGRKGKGVGQDLMMHAARIARDDGKSFKVKGVVSSAAGFYAKMGGDQPYPNNPKTFEWSTKRRDALAAGRPMPLDLFVDPDEVNWSDGYATGPLVTKRGDMFGVPR